MDRIEVSGDNHGENIVLLNEILLLTRLIRSCYQNNLILDKTLYSTNDYVTSTLIAMVPIIIVSNFSLGMGQYISPT